MILLRQKLYSRKDNKPKDPKYPKDPNKPKPDNNKPKDPNKDPNKPKDENKDWEDYGTKNTRMKPGEKEPWLIETYGKKAGNWIKKQWNGGDKGKNKTLNRSLMIGIPSAAILGTGIYHTTKQIKKREKQEKAEKQILGKK